MWPQKGGGRHGLGQPSHCRGLSGRVAVAPSTPLQAPAAPLAVACPSCACIPTALNPSARRTPLQLALEAVGPPPVVGLEAATRALPMVCRGAAAVTTTAAAAR